MKRRYCFLLCILSGCLTFLSFPTYNLFPFLFIALVPLLWATEGLSPKKAFWYGWLAGFVTNFGGFHWITELLIDFGHMPRPIALAICIVVTGYQGLLFGLWIGFYRWLENRYSVPNQIYAITIFVALEFTLPLVFPWYMANGLYLFTPFVQSADLFGVLGVTALILSVNLTVWEFLRRWLLSREWLPKSEQAEPPFAKRFVVVTLVLVIINLVYGFIQINRYDSFSEEAEKLKIGLVEADIGIWEKEAPDKLRNNLIIHQNLSAPLEQEQVDLIVWPESSYHVRKVWGSQEVGRDVTYLEWSSLLKEPYASVAVQGVKLTRPLFGDLLSGDPFLSPYVVALVRTVKGGGSPINQGYTYLLPDNITYLRPSFAPLVSDSSDDTRRETKTWDRRALQRGFRTAVLFGTLTMKSNPKEESTKKSKGVRFDGTIYNSALLIDKDGVVLGKYHKNHLLIFGEYVPYADKIPWIFDLVPEASNLSPGTSVEVFKFKGFTIGLLICYEDIIPSFNRRLARKHPNVIINVTNDAWFGKTDEPYLHMALATFRAIENRTWLLRSTNTGVSCFVDANGRVVKETGLYDPEVLVSEVPMLPGGQTLYILVGDILGWLSLLFVLGVIGMTLPEWSRERAERKRKKGRKKSKRSRKSGSSKN